VGGPCANGSRRPRGSQRSKCTRVSRDASCIDRTTMSSHDLAPGKTGGKEEEELLPALFWDGTEDWINEDNCADYAALQSLKYDDTTPLERAEEYKLKGNDALKYKQNKLYVRKAVQQYTLALIESFDDDVLRAVIHGNRAHAALLLGNFGKALEDAKACVKLDATNVKGLFRAAKSAYGLHKLDECAGFCDAGLRLEPTNNEFRVIIKNVKKQIEVDAKKEKRLAFARVATKEAVSTFADRKLKLGPHVMGTGEHFPEIVTHSDGKYPANVFFWVLFVYPESMQTDVIEIFHEHATIGSQADTMFGPGSPALEWDSAKSYTREKVEFYYQSNASAVYPPDVLFYKLMQKHGEEPDDGETQRPEWTAPKPDQRDQKMIKVDETKTIGEVLAKDGNVIPGHPIFYVVARDTEFREKFLAGEWEL
jgi:hypothetical protein